MDIDFAKISLNRGLNAVEMGKNMPVEKVQESAVKPLFGDSLTINEDEKLSLDGVKEVDTEEMEKELVRDDKLGKLMTSHLNWPTPEMPVFADPLDITIFNTRSNVIRNM